MPYIRQSHLFLGVLAIAVGCGEVPDQAVLDQTSASAPDPAGSRMTLRERVVFAGSENQTFSIGDEPFSHMGRRWHAYTLTVYRKATIGARLATSDPAMFGQAAVRIYGPARADGSWGPPREAVASAQGVAVLPVSALSAGRYVVVVGPQTANGFLDRYPADIGTGVWADNGEESPQFFLLAHDGWVTYRENGDRYRVVSPLPGNQASEDPLPTTVFELDGPNGRVKWKLGEWSRTTWFVRDDAIDRIGDAGNLRMEEGLLDIDRVVNGQALPEEEDRFLVLSAVGLGNEAHVNPDLLQVIPETIDGRKLGVRADDGCLTGNVCNEAYYLDDGKSVDVDATHKLVRGFKPTFYDPGETSTYDLEVECDEGCTPRPAGKLSSTKYPMYYAHGFNSSKLTWTHLLDTHINAVPGMPGWYGAEDVDAFSPVVIRAEQLRRNLLALIRQTEATDGVAAGDRFVRINVVAHSMGGLDSRYLMGAARYNQSCATSQCTDAAGTPESCCPPPDLDGNPTTWGQRIASLTTVSTPHCGSSFADLGVKALRKELVHKGFELVARKMFGLDKAGRELLEKTMFALSQQFCAELMKPGFPAPAPNRVYDFECPDGQECKLPPPLASVPTIFSWSGMTCISGSCGDIVDAALMPSYLYVKSQEGDNDGVVSVTSAHFGIYMGVLPHDHFDWTRTQAESKLEEAGGRLAGWLFGVRKEPAERFHLEWVDRLREAGY